MSEYYSIFYHFTKTTLNNFNIKEHFKIMFSDSDAILKHSETTVDWWLTGIAIGIATLTILFSLVIFFIGRGLNLQIKNEIINLNRELDSFTKDFRRLKSTTIREAREMNNEAKSIIEELKSYRTEAQLIKNKMDELGKINDPKDDKLDESDKQNAKQIAKSIEDNIYASECQKLLASAYDSFYSDNFDEAITKYLLLLNKHQDELTVAQLSNVFYRIGYSNLALKKYPASLEFFLKFLNINSNDYNALCNIGLTYQHLSETENSNENLKLALNYYQKAIELKPKDEDDWIFSKLAEIFVLTYDYKSAIEWYNKALKVNKNSDNYIFAKIECLIMNNNLKEAKDELNNYARTNPKVSFDTIFLSSLIEIIEGTETSADEVYKKMRLESGTKIETTDWDFIEFERWLKSDYSNFVVENAKTILVELQKHLNDWKNES